MEILYMLVGAALFIGGFFVGRRDGHRLDEAPTTPQSTDSDEKIKKQIENWYRYDGRPQG